MEVNKSEVAQFLMDVRSKSSTYSKQDFKAIFTKLYFILVDIEDLSPPAYQQYENRSVSGKQLSQICDLLVSSEGEKLGVVLEHRMLISILEVTMGSLMELTNRKIESVVDIFVQYFYKGGTGHDSESVLQSSFVLDKLTKCFDLKTVKRTV